MDNQTYSLIDNYVELYAFICTKKEMYEDKLKFLEIESNCLFAKTNKDRVIELRLEINATKSFIKKANELCLDLSEKYKNLAMAFNNIDAMIFCAIFFESKTAKQVALEFGLSTDYVYKKKSQFNKMIKDVMDNNITNLEEEGS